MCSSCLALSRSTSTPQGKWQEAILHLPFIVVACQWRFRKMQADLAYRTTRVRITSAHQSSEIGTLMYWQMPLPLWQNSLPAANNAGKGEIAGIQGSRLAWKTPWTFAEEIGAEPLTLAVGMREFWCVCREFGLCYSVLRTPYQMQSAFSPPWETIHLVRP